MTATQDLDLTLIPPDFYSQAFQVREVPLLTLRSQSELNARHTLSFSFPPTSPFHLAELITPLSVASKLQRLSMKNWRITSRSVMPSKTSISKPSWNYPRNLSAFSKPVQLPRLKMRKYRVGSLRSKIFFSASWSISWIHIPNFKVN